MKEPRDRCGEHRHTHSATREDVQLRFAVAYGEDYEFTIVSANPLKISVKSENQPSVVVAPGSESWCTCDEDAVPGTCSHVLFLTRDKGDVGANIRDALTQDFERSLEKIQELKRELSAQEVRSAALRRAVELTS